MIMNIQHFLSRQLKYSKNLKACDCCWFTTLIHITLTSMPDNVWSTITLFAMPLIFRIINDSSSNKLHGCLFITNFYPS